MICITILEDEKLLLLSMIRMWPVFFLSAQGSVQSLSHMRLFATPWTVARQDSVSITSSRSLRKLMSIESVMPSNHFILCCPLLLLSSIFLSIRVFSNELVLHIGGQSIGVSALASVLPMADGVISDFGLPVGTTLTCFTH